MKITQEHIESYREKLLNYGNSGTLDVFHDKMIILDMLYLMGAAVDPDEYEFAPGFQKFLQLVREIVNANQDEVWT